jgi:hypothetical protein
VICGVRPKNKEMIRYSHVSLLILCDAAGVDIISTHLGCVPSRVDHDPKGEVPKTGLTHIWRLDSPLGHSDADPTVRLEALVTVIEPFGDRLLSLDPAYRPFVDIVYHVTPQRLGGITGEFDWFRLPAPLIRRLASFNIDVSYESFWFDHPDWRRIRQPWWHRFLPQTQA